jgi:putative phosphoribosyl transferase
MRETLCFRDRRDAGEQLASRVLHLSAERPVILALPRGGVPVAGPVAARLHAPLDVLVVRKLGLPYQPELAMGAIGEEGARVLEQTVIRQAGINAQQIASAEANERVEVERRAARYRDGRAPIPIAGRVVVIIDDGIATGSTARAAIEIARHRGAARVILATPVAAAESARELESLVDEFVCLATPRDFRAVGQFYGDFGQTSDAEVVSVLAENRSRSARPEVSGAAGVVDRDVEVVADGVALPGHLIIPDGARGVVLFAHGSGSSARSPRNRFVAERLNAAGVGTLLFDLLTPSESLDRANVFDIELLARRLRGATRWMRRRRPAGVEAMGYFGASTGAAAALLAAADPTVHVDAVVSRGGRVDLAADALADLNAPTLMIVGGADSEVLRLNRTAADRMNCTHEVVVVPGASHLFEERGALDAAARHASVWFERYLGNEPLLSTTDTEDEQRR